MRFSFLVVFLFFRPRPLEKKKGEGGPTHLVGDLELVQEVVRGLADDHRREELAAEPRAAAGGDAWCLC